MPSLLDRFSRHPSPLAVRCLALVAALALCRPAEGTPALRILPPRTASGGPAWSWERLGGWLWGLLALPASDDAGANPQGNPSNPAVTPNVQVVPVQPTVVPPPPPPSNPPGLKTTTDPNG